MVDTDSTVYIGYAFVLCAAFLTSLSMCVQRYALAYPAPTVPTCGLQVPRLRLYSSGLLMYVLASVCKVVAQQYASFTVLASLFTVLLVFNLGLARCINGERITAGNVFGALLIFGGAMSSIYTAPAEVRTEFTPDDIMGLLHDFWGKWYFYTLLVVVVLSLLLTVAYELWYPLVSAMQNAVAQQVAEYEYGPGGAAVFKMHGELQRKMTKKLSKCDSVGDSDDGSRAGSRVGSRVLQRIAGVKAFQACLDAEEAFASGSSTGHHSALAPSSTKRRTFEPPKRLAGFMAFIYPVSLGLDEAIVELCVKAVVALFASCQEQSCDQSDSILVAFLTSLYVVGGLLSALWWMKNVYARYETTAALPLEYGALNVANVFTGLIFYQERLAMSWEQIVYLGLGVLLVVAGIGVTYYCGTSQAEPGDAPEGVVRDAEMGKGVEMDDPRTPLNRDQAVTPLDPDQTEDDAEQSVADDLQKELGAYVLAFAVTHGEAGFAKKWSSSSHLVRFAQAVRKMVKEAVEGVEDLQWPEDVSQRPIQKLRIPSVFEKGM